MYEYKKRTGKIKRLFIAFLLIAMSSLLTIFIYSMYIDIDVYSKENDNNQGAIRLSQNIVEEKEEENITSVLEKTIKCVVGISKIKNTGNSIFLNNSTKELGLGTGIIVTDNRLYINKLTCGRK